LVVSATAGADATNGDLDFFKEGGCEVGEQDQ
jgi:hypothetical protein